jgi:hypothetical protein
MLVLAHGEDLVLEYFGPPPTVAFFESQTAFEETFADFTDVDSIGELDRDPAGHVDQVGL